MGAAARLLADQFGWARMARRYLDLYRGFANQADVMASSNNTNDTSDAQKAENVAAV